MVMTDNNTYSIMQCSRTRYYIMVLVLLGCKGECTRGLPPMLCCFTSASTPDELVLSNASQ